MRRCYHESTTAGGWCFTGFLCGAVSWPVTINSSLHLLPHSQSINLQLSRLALSRKETRKRKIYWQRQSVSQFAMKKSLYHCFISDHLLINLNHRNVKSIYLVMKVSILYSIWPIKANETIRDVAVSMLPHLSADTFCLHFPWQRYRKQYI